MKLYIVPTPIGNLEDITLRAINVLKSVDVVLAEDTRTSGNLLKHLGISKPLHSYHIHNEHQTVARVVERIRKGETMALVSDAGTPAVSDPGFLLVRACIREGVPVALVNSGLPNDRFTFEGFLPHKKGRQTRLQNLANEERTMVFYESPHRLVKALQQFAEHFGADRQVCVSRELSKMFEENVRGTVTEVIAHFGDKPVKGEIVIVVAGKADGKRKPDEDDD
jgi:16S rRNA (cytidine1402-2'-O)-methyltransferase